MNFAPQVYTLKRRLQILGKEKLRPEDVDYDPSTIAPVSIPNDSRPSWKILQEYMKNFSVYIAPNSIQERNSYMKKLALLQVQKAGGTISDRAIYDAFVGDDNYNQMRAEFFEEQEKKALAAAAIQIKVELLQKQIAQGTNPPEQTHKMEMDSNHRIQLFINYQMRFFPNWVQPKLITKDEIQQTKLRLA